MRSRAGESRTRAHAVEPREAGFEKDAGEEWEPATKTVR